MKSSMNVKTSQKGFTLIELVVVIVILGILAVTAAPKFIDLTSDAKASTIEAVKGSLNSAADMAHAKSLVNGTLNDDISIAGLNISFINGYPTAESIKGLMDINSTLSNADPVGDFTHATTGDNTGSGVTTYGHPTAVTPSTCVATYTETDDENLKPVIASDTEGC